MNRAAEIAFSVAAQSIRSTRNDGFVDDEVPKKHRKLVRFLLGQLAGDLWRKAGVRACRVCGCTEDDACGIGCAWVGLSLCSSCAPPASMRPQFRKPTDKDPRLHRGGPR